MKRNAIIESEFSVLENAIITYGNVVSFSELIEFFDKDIQYTRKRISRLVEQGWLMRLKKGVYVISDLSTRGTLAIQQETVVNLLVEDAYISFQKALQFHGLYNQLLSSINAVSLQRFKTTKIDSYSFNFIYTQEKYFYGWETHEIDGQDVKIATIEKSLIDLIQFHRTRYSTDIVLEKLMDYQDQINLDKLHTYLLQANLTTQRIFGFLFDLAKLDGQKLLNSIETSKSVSYITKSEENIYNHKWKLYYDEYFKKYIQEKTY